MLIGYFCLAALAVVAVLRRGRIAQLASVRLRHLELVGAALLDQVVVIGILPGRHRALLAAAHLLSYAAAGAFFYLNRRVPGMLLVGAGGLANAVAITANAGTLPASPSALRAAAWQPSPDHFDNSAALAHPHLLWLGDIFATPRWLPGHDVFSLGDVVICLGIAVFLWRVTAPRTEAERRGPSGPPVAADRYPRHRQGGNASGSAGSW